RGGRQPQSRRRVRHRRGLRLREERLARAGVRAAVSGQGVHLRAAEFRHGHGAARLPQHGHQVLAAAGPPPQEDRSMRRHSRRSVTALLVIPLLVTAGIGIARAGSTQTATIRGHVADDKGEALVGVTLNFRSDKLIGEKALITDANGNYFVSGLPPGKYTVTAQLGGYITTAVETLLVIDQTTVQNILLKAGDLTETVTVEGTKPVVDTQSTEGAVVVDTEFANTIPTPRLYQNLIGFAPGVTNVPSGNPNVAGGTSSSNNYLFDGVSTRDPVTGTFGANL